uniref:GNAT family N-acetyltransferase n=1 Tax=Thaumasiovibrio occultus TaxID=1891184 RepID=UPI0018656425|nr:GNAT family N-acetyltransferase [Thaumasiovibrio occultus]
MDIMIQQATQSDLKSFFDYLNDHLSDNGSEGTPLFQPLSREESQVSAGLMTRFEQGMATPISINGWRRLWLAINDSSDIVGHIDMRSHPESNTQHRALLGMGVDRKARNQGLGTRLIGELLAYAEKETDLERFDLWVLSSNLPAIALYQKAGFSKQGELTDMFRIDGASYGYTLMSRAISDE